MRHSVLVGAALLMVLAGCAMDQHGFKVASEADLAAARARQEAADGSQSKPTDLPQPPSPLPVPDHEPPMSVLLANKTDTNPDRLVGLSLAETERLLGKPALQDERPPAKVWTYNAANCVLNIFFYLDINRQEFQALTYEIKNADPSDAAKHKCFAELMRGHAT